MPQPILTRRIEADDPVGAKCIPRRIYVMYAQAPLVPPPVVLPTFAFSPSRWRRRPSFGLRQSATTGIISRDDKRWEGTRGENVKPFSAVIPPSDLPNR